MTNEDTAIRDLAAAAIRAGETRAAFIARCRVGFERARQAGEPITGSRAVFLSRCRQLFVEAQAGKSAPRGAVTAGPVMATVTADSVAPVKSKAKRKTVRKVKVRRSRT